MFAMRLRSKKPRSSALSPAEPCPHARLHSRSASQSADSAGENHEHQPSRPSCASALADRTGHRRTTVKTAFDNLGLQALAVLMTGFPLLLIELAAYFALVQAWSAIASAAIVSLCNLVIAVIAALLILLAQRRSASR